ncbi:MAG: hypothetical protein KDK36_13870, partial [Leptospiraceae bacterium]|nr:hypothetical protein [Leptospiraceae bacterium]
MDLSEKRLNNWKISTDGKIWENTKVPSNILENDKYKDSETFFLKTKFDFIFNSDKQYSLRLGIISDKDIVYINNHIIGNSENFSSYLPGNYDKVRIYEIPSYLLQEKNNEIKIKIKRYFDYEAGILNEVPTIGESSSIHSKILHQEYLKILFLSIYAVISIFFLFLYIRGARDISYIYFFLASFSVILYQFLRTQLKYDLNFNFIFFKKVEYITLAIAIFLYANFIHSIFRKNKFKNPFKFFVNSLEKGKFKNFLLFFKYDSIQLLNIIYVLGFILYFKKQEIKEFDIINK